MGITRFESLTVLAAAVVVITLAMPAAASHHVDGTWLLDVDLGGQGGQATITLEESEGGKLTGKYRGQLGEAEVTGTVDGDKVSFSFDSQAGKISYEGTVSDGTMKGTCTYGQLGSGTFTGKKKTESE